jgi:hypothetical protein
MAKSCWKLTANVGRIGTTDDTDLHRALLDTDLHGLTLLKRRVKVQNVKLRIRLP